MSSNNKETPRPAPWSLDSGSVGGVGWWLYRDWKADEMMKLMKLMKLRLGGDREVDQRQRQDQI